MTHIGTLSIAVKDSGAGLSPQQLAEICAEGVQFNANELQAGQGSGLGLFISKGIVEQHGGRLRVESGGLGKGVTFTAELPLFRSVSQGDVTGSRTRLNGLGVSFSTAQSDPDSTSYAHRANSAHSMIVAAAPPSSRRLLVVDDSALNRKMITRLLSAKDHTCEQAGDGEAAVQKYLEMVEHGEPPDAILMDFEMPVMNGPTATARLRKLGCACLIVGVTGNVLSQDVAFFKEKGANAVLPKPIVLEDFEQLLADHQESEPPARSGANGASVHAALFDRVKPQTLALAPSGDAARIYPEQGDFVHSF
jgi:CheY-like chemotaxis protein